MRLTTRQREGLVQAAKMAAAATAAWLLAKQVHAPQSFMAPYAAVFLISETVYRSLAEAARLVVTLVLGVLLAFLAITMVPNVAFALPGAVLVGMVVGRWHRLGDSGIWIAVTALLMLTYGTADDMGYLGYRVLEGVLGALVGLAVNTLVLPPLHLRDSWHAVADVAAELSDLIHTIADGLRGGWGPEDARGWRRRARALETAVRRAEDAQVRSHESTRFNPRWALRYRRHELPEQRLGTLYEVARQIQHMTEALVAAGDGHAPHAGRDFPRSFADLLDTLANAVRDSGHQAHDRPDRQSRRWQGQRPGKRAKPRDNRREEPDQQPGDSQPDQRHHWHNQRPGERHDHQDTVSTHDPTPQPHVTHPPEQQHDHQNTHQPAPAPTRQPHDAQPTEQRHNHQESHTHDQQTGERHNHQNTQPTHEPARQPHDEHAGHTHDQQTGERHNHQNVQPTREPARQPHDDRHDGQSSERAAKRRGAWRPGAQQRGEQRRGAWRQRRSEWQRGERHSERAESPDSSHSSDHSDAHPGPPAGEQARYLDPVVEARERSRRCREMLAVRGALTDDGTWRDWSTEAALLLAVERACDATLVE